MSYSILSPYIIPPEVKTLKRGNIGDGFILFSIKKLLEPQICECLLSTRRPLSSEEIARINATKALILAGANQLNDNFTMLPGMDPQGIKRIKIPIIPFGIGINGIRKFNRKMSDITKDILKIIHEKIQFSSWRCPATVAYLNEHIPELSARFLMTGCPVQYDTNLLNHIPFYSPDQKIIVTITERDVFYEREFSTIKYISEKYMNSEKILSLHQEIDTPRFPVLLRRIVKGQFNKIRKPSALHGYAESRGFRIYRPTSVEDCQAFYRTCDMHVGSRLHAHLFFLSQAKKSFLTYVDDRCVGFSEAFAFPLCDYRNLDQYLGYDFEIYRTHALSSFEVMKIFLSYVKTQILEAR